MISGVNEHRRPTGKIAVLRRNGLLDAIRASEKYHSLFSLEQGTVEEYGDEPWVARMNSDGHHATATGKTPNDAIWKAINLCECHNGDEIIDYWSLPRED